MIKLRYILPLLLTLLSFSPLSAGSTAQETLQGCIAKLNRAKSVKADFTFTAQGKSSSGQLLSKGNKFAIVSGNSGSWYDGSSISVYSPSTKEVTVWKPSSSELAESNPLMYLSSAGNYTVTQASGASGGEKMLTLTPKMRGSGIKSIKVKINTSTMLPTYMEISSNGGVIKLSLKNVTLNSPIADSNFKFPKSKYPGARINDLR